MGSEVAFWRTLRHGPSPPQLHFVPENTHFQPQVDSAEALWCQKVPFFAPSWFALMSLVPRRGLFPAKIGKWR